MLAAIQEDEPPPAFRGGQQTFAGGQEEQPAGLISTTSSATGSANRKIPSTTTTFLRGVVFGRSVRSAFATLHVVRVNEEAQAISSALDHADADDDDDDEEAVVMIRLQFLDNAPALRSYCRRFCKLGDLLCVVVDDTNNNNNQHPIEWQLPDERVATDWRSRLVVHVDSPEAAARTVPVVERHCWSMPQCQRWQRLYLPVVTTTQKQTTIKVATTAGANNNNMTEQVYDHETSTDATGMTTPPIWMDDPSAENHHIGSSSSSNNNNHHGGGLGKRTQGQYIASFLLHMVAHQKMNGEPKNDDGLEINSNNCSSSSSSSSNNNSIPSDPSEWSQQYDKLIASPSLLQQARDYLNHHAGVLDVAGGSGHVSMALSLLGVRCTVVDPRENVGRLPKRDRKVYHRALKQQQQQRQQQQQQSKESNNDGSSASINTTTDAHSSTTAIAEEIYCQPVGSVPSTTTVIPFGRLRAWFGAPPDGVDTSFRHPDQDNLAAVVDDATLSRCSAIVALHADEATDAIVDTAVRWRIPFLVVPCCVFSRLFSHRKLPSGEPVTTHQQLLDYLMAKDKSIQKTTLPFEGSNTILWSCFGDKNPLSKADG